jgi:hypothetical protein
MKRKLSNPVFIQETADASGLLELETRRPLLSFKWRKEEK